MSKYNETENVKHALYRNTGTNKTVMGEHTHTRARACVCVCVFVLQQTLC
jgi:hypothetical protein